jgi:hypothetical protein
VEETLVRSKSVYRSKELNHSHTEGEAVRSDRSTEEE